MAFVAPQRPSIQIGDVSFNPFCDALELYARTRGKEKRDEESYGMLLRMAAEAGVKLAEETASESDAPPDAPCDGDSCPVVYRDRPPEGMRYEDVVGVDLPKPPDTHTHSRGQ